MKWLPSLGADVAAADKNWIKRFGSLASGTCPRLLQSCPLTVLFSWPLLTLLPPAGPFNTLAYCPTEDEAYFHGVANWIISVAILSFTVVFLLGGVVWMRMRSRRVTYENIY